MHWAPAIPWKREHFPLADSCDFGPCSDYRTPVHLWFLASHDAILQLAIRDDGIGGADPAQGSGLVGLSDRIEAVGGTLQVTSPVGGGTTLLIEIPV